MAASLSPSLFLFLSLKLNKKYCEGEKKESKWKEKIRLGMPDSFLGDHFRPIVPTPNSGFLSRGPSLLESLPSFRPKREKALLPLTSLLHYPLCFPTFHPHFLNGPYLNPNLNMPFCLDPD